MYIYGERNSTIETGVMGVGEGSVCASVQNMEGGGEGGGTTHKPSSTLSEQSQGQGHCGWNRKEEATEGRVYIYGERDSTIETGVMGVGEGRVCASVQNMEGGGVGGSTLCEQLVRS